MWNEGTTIVSYESGGECRCGSGGSQTTNDHGFYGGTCTAPTGKKKRDADITTVETRKKREVVNTIKERKFECVSWHNGEAAYWKYDFVVPSKCYSMSNYFFQFTYFLYFFSVVNCTQADLEAIVTNNPELYLNGSISSLKYGTKYRYLPIVSTDYKFLALDTIVPPLGNSLK